MTAAAAVPLAPFTLAELNARRDEWRLKAGHYVAAVLNHGDTFEAYDVAILRDYTAMADAYHAAAVARGALDGAR